MNISALFMELYTEKYGSHITGDIARQLVAEMPITDGSDRESGEKWTVEESAEMAGKVNADLSKIDKYEWYLVLNNMYSDYYRTGKRHGMNDLFYAELAYDWFYDMDAEEDKTFRYFMHF